jgi:hypothetical protein
VANEDGRNTGNTGSIEPATVTINTLTINGKQVTPDIFLQLKDAVLINHDGSFAGPPWGMGQLSPKKVRNYPAATLGAVLVRHL